MPKDLQNITKLAKLRQVWSHWSLVNVKKVLPKAMEMKAATVESVLEISTRVVEKSLNFGFLLFLLFMYFIRLSGIRTQDLVTDTSAYGQSYKCSTTL